MAVKYHPIPSAFFKDIPELRSAFESLNLWAVDMERFITALAQAPEAYQLEQGDVSGGDALTSRIPGLSIGNAEGDYIGVDSGRVQNQSDWLPDGDAQVSLGSATRRWKNLHLSGDAVVGGTLTLDDFTLANHDHGSVAEGGALAESAITDHEAAIDHDALLNYVAAQHIDWTQSGAGTIHADNYVDNVGTGDVVGPAGSTDGYLALFDLTTGKLLKEGTWYEGSGGALIPSGGANIGQPVPPGLRVADIYMTGTINGLTSLAVNTGDVVLASGSDLDMTSSTVKGDLVPNADGTQGLGGLYGVGNAWASVYADAWYGSDLGAGSSADVSMYFSSTVSVVSDSFISWDVAGSGVVRAIKIQGNPTLDDWFDQSVKAADSPTFVNPIFTAPVFTDYTNANHDHADVPGGGTLTTAATPTAIHDDTASEISAITNKATPVSGDYLLIEDSAAGNVKKHVTVGSLPGGGGGETNTGSNQGTDGVGVYDTKAGVDLQFRHVAPASSKVTTVLNGKDIDIDVVEANIDHDSLLNYAANEHYDWENAQIPDIHINNIPTITVATGGTGQTTQTAAFDALAPTTTKGDVIVHNGTDNIRVAVGTDTHVLTADSAEASGVKWAAGGGGSASALMAFSGAAAIVAKGATEYLGISGGDAGTTEANAEFYVPAAYNGLTVEKMYVYVSANGSNNAGNTVTLRKNGASQSVTVSYGSGTTGLLSDTSNSFTVATGDTIAIQVVNTGSGGGTKNIVVESVSFQIT